MGVSSVCAGYNRCSSLPYCSMSSSQRTEMHRMARVYQIPCANDCGLPLEQVVEVATDKGRVSALRLGEYLVVPAHGFLNGEPRCGMSVKGIQYKFVYSGMTDINNPYDIAIFKSNEIQSRIEESPPIFAMNDDMGQAAVLMTCLKGRHFSQPVNVDGELFHEPTAPGFSGGVIVAQDAFSNDYHVIGLHVGEGRFISMEKIKALISLSQNPKNNRPELLSGYLQPPGLYEPQVLPEIVVSAINPPEGFFKKIQLDGLEEFRTLFSDHTLFGHDNSGPCQFKKPLPGRHVACTQEQAFQIVQTHYQSTQHKHPLTILIFDKNETKVLEQVQDAINVRNTMWMNDRDASKHACDTLRDRGIQEKPKGNRYFNGVSVPEKKQDEIKLIGSAASFFGRGASVVSFSRIDKKLEQNKKLLDVFTLEELDACKCSDSMDLEVWFQAPVVNDKLPVVTHLVPLKNEEQEQSFFTNKKGKSYKGQKNKGRKGKGKKK